MPGTLQEGGAAFASTHWSVVLLTAQSESPEAAQAAMASFCQAYWPPLYTLLRRRGRSPSDAQDLIQGFFVHLLEQNTLARATREKGRLRTFLLGSLQHFLAHEHVYQQASKRGGGKQIVSMDDHLIEAEAAMLNAAHSEATDWYDRQWAANLLSRVWDRVYESMVTDGRKPLIDALQPFVVGGMGVLPDQVQTAAQLQMPISSFRNALRRLRLRYHEELRAEVAATVSNPAEVENELGYLFRLLVT